MFMKKIDFHEFIESITEMLDMKDTYTKGHSHRVADYTSIISKLINLNDEEQEKAHISGHLHDIGKIGIPDFILQKTGKLTNEEFEIMKKHSEFGYNTLIKVDGLKEIAKIIKAHHERWDGFGYPDKLKEKEIPLISRILSITDSFDAMTSNRSYRIKLSFENACLELLKNKWTQFDGDLVDVFVDYIRKTPDFK